MVELNRIYNEDCLGVMRRTESGTTAIAAINTNRNYIGFELDKEYYEIAQERITKSKE